MKTICGLNCDECVFKNECDGCVKSNGKPFGEVCPVAKCCLNKGFAFCEECKESSCHLSQNLINEFNALGIKDMPEVTSLNVLKGSYVNLEYTLPTGQNVKFLSDNKLYFGNQLAKKDTQRCYGIIGDETFLLVSEYGQQGENPKLIIYKTF